MRALKAILMVTALMINWQAIATVQVMIIEVTDTETYTVPAGKVLLIDKIPEMGWSDLVLSNGTTSVQLNGIHFDGGWSPVRVPENWTLRSSNSSPLVIFGRLVDPADLYASIDSQADHFLVADNTFTFDVIAASSRPARFSVAGSSDLTSSWQMTSATVEKKTSNIYTVAVPVEDQSQYYAKYLVRSYNP